MPKNISLTTELVDRLLDGDMARKPRAVTEAARKKASKAPANDMPDYDAATKRVLIDAGIMMPDGSWAQGSSTALGEAPKPQDIGPILSPNVVQKFVAVDTSKDKQLLAWMLFQAAGGLAGKRDSEAHIEEAKEKYFEEWRNGYYVDETGEKVHVCEPKTPEECETEWAAVVVGFRKSLNPADEGLMKQFANAVFGYLREWPGHDKIYEKVAAAASKYVENTTKQNGVSLMDKANLAVRQKAFKDTATAIIIAALWPGHDLTPGEAEAVRKLVAYLASGQKPVPPQPLGPNPTEPAEKRYAIMSAAYAIAAKVVADGELDHGIRERIESELASNPNSRPLDASLSTNEAGKGSSGRQPLRTLDDMVGFNHEVFVRFAKSRAVKDTRYIVRSEDPQPADKPLKGAYHTGHEAPYYENDVYKVVIPATLAASVQSVEPLFRPPEAKEGDSQFCTSQSSQFDTIFSRNREDYHWFREQRKGAIVYLIAKNPMPPELAENPVRLVAMQFTSPDLNTLTYFMKNNRAVQWEEVRRAADAAGVGAELQDAAEHAVEAMKHVRDMIQRDVRESAERLVTALLD